MDETRRFLRYVVPGLVFLTELGLLLLVSSKATLISALLDKLQLSGTVLAALILAIAGGLGYIFSLVHHTLFWKCSWTCRKYGIDHRKFVKAALAHGWLRLVTYGERNNVAGECLTREAAEDVITILWYRPGRTGDTKDPELGETLVRRMDAISDLMHGLGAGFIAVICAGAACAAIYLWLRPESVPPSRLGRLSDILPAVFVEALLIGLHFSNYWRVRNRLARLVESALATHFTRAVAPAVIFVDRSALKRERR